jgi:7-carboxy-7-deazaguanine synthase
MNYDLNMKYPLMEDFYTIQGEGFNTGKAAYFLRLGGCDVGCVWCDVKESWPADTHPQVSIAEMISRIEKAKADMVVITGGEPCMYDLLPLTHSLHAKFMSCWLETSGAHPITGEWEWICVSPKKFKAPLAESLQQADELKIIIYNKSDFDWAEEHASKVHPDCVLFLQPEYSVFNNVMPMIVEYVKQHPKWRISIQTHKVMQIP